jgi:phosphoglycolate phosphatase
VPGCFTDVPALLEEGGLDVRSASVRVGSVMAEATAKDLAFLWSQHFTGGGVEEKVILEVIETTWAAASKSTDSVVPLGPEVYDTMARHRDLGISLGLVTNDTESTGREMLSKLGVLEMFDVVVGYDSGWGAKPQPAGVLSALRQLGVNPCKAVMVGDSPADIQAGLAAGCMARVAISQQSVEELPVSFDGTTHAVSDVRGLLELIPKDDCNY